MSECLAQVGTESKIAFHDQRKPRAAVHATGTSGCEGRAESQVETPDKMGKVGKVGRAA